MTNVNIFEMPDDELLEFCRHKVAKLLEEVKPWQEIITTLEKKLGKNSLKENTYSKKERIQSSSSTSYAPKPIEELIKDGLAELGEADAETMSNYLYKMNPDQDKEKLFKTITVRMSRMYRDQQLTFKKGKGKRYIYMLK